MYWVLKCIGLYRILIFIEIIDIKSLKYMFRDLFLIIMIELNGIK